MKADTLNCKTHHEDKGRDLLILITYSVIVLAAIIFAIVAEDLINNPKLIRYIATPPLAFMLGISIWRGSRFVPTSNPKNAEGSFPKVSVWMALGIATVFLILFYLGTFKSDISF